MKESINKIKYFIVPVVLLFIMFIFIRPSFAAPETTNRIMISSDKANYMTEEDNSWLLQKSAKWIGNNEAEIELTVNSKPEEFSYTDLILVLDNTEEESARYLGDYFRRVGYYESLNYNVSIISYKMNSSDILLEESNDINAILNVLYDLERNYSRDVNVDYYKALLNLENMLTNFDNMENRDIAILFVGAPHSGVEAYNQDAEFDLIKEKFDNSEFFYINTATSLEKGFLNSKVNYIGNNVELLLSADLIKKFIVTDYINLDKFEFKEISNNTYKFIAVKCLLEPRAQFGVLGRESPSRFEYDYYGCNDKVEKEMNNVIYDEETGRIIWDLSNSIYSTSASLKIKVKLKDEYINSDEIFYTNKSTSVETNLNDIEEYKFTNNSPALKLNYNIHYNWNSPEGCYREPEVEAYKALSTVNVQKNIPVCNGYEFKGWYGIGLTHLDVCLNPDYYGISESEYRYYCTSKVSQSFEMPSNDVYLTAVWGKIGVDKHFEGDEFGSYAIYSIGQKGLVNATEISEATHTRSSTTINVRLDTLDAVAEYDIKAVNLTDKDLRVEVDSINSNNDNITYEIVNNTYVRANSETTFTLKIHYNGDITTLPDNKEALLTVRYTFKKDGAMFLTGSEVNQKMDELSEKSIFSNENTRIKDIVRYEGIPDSSVLIDENIVSEYSPEFPDPIYMWYDSETGIIYWYSKATNVYYNYDASYFYSYLRALNTISCIDDISSKYVTNMSGMFTYVGNNNFKTLKLGDKFDTSNVTNMESMFSNNDYLELLDLGPNFDTSKVTNMMRMFEYDKKLEKILVSSKFVTSNVTRSYNMFYRTENIVGGLGTTYNSSFIDKKYAHIDGGTENPGYLSDRDKIDKAMFLPGQEVNAKMKRFVNSSATYSTKDTTITNIARYTDIPNPTYLTDTYKVSVDEYITPIYMWYDSSSTTIYWYSEASNVYYNPDSSSFFYNLRAINSISCMNDISSEYVANMQSMFSQTGYNSTAFTLNLGDKFDTSNVTNMSSMFSYTGNSNTSFTLDLGSLFDTSNVTDMSSMFYSTGYMSTNFTLDLGSKFDTSKVKNMQGMFAATGYCSKVFTLDLGDLFDTSNVTNMVNMFNGTGYISPVFTLDLGDKFNTSNVTNMKSMFDHTGYKSEAFTLDLGNKYDTSKVTNMDSMFWYTGYSSKVLTLDLGDKFDTSSVTNMYALFAYTGRSSPVFTLDLGSKFDTSNVTNMSNIFSYTGSSNTAFTLDLGDKFDTSNVTNMSNMFNSTGRISTIFTLDLGDLFDTSKVTTMAYMFAYTGFNSQNFTLDLGDLFNTSKVTDMAYMFTDAGYNSQNFTLDLGDKFDTSKVTSMDSMLSNAGRNSRIFILDLGDLFNTSKVTDMDYMFNNYRGTTIYAPSSFVTTSVTSSTNMFSECYYLVGGSGTIYNGRNITATYAHIDGGPSNPGYFTARP